MDATVQCVWQIKHEDEYECTTLVLIVISMHLYIQHSIVKPRSRRKSLYYLYLAT